MHSVNKVMRIFRRSLRCSPNRSNKGLPGGWFRHWGASHEFLTFCAGSLPMSWWTARKNAYQFTWPDKKKSKPPGQCSHHAGALRPCREKRRFDTTENLYARRQSRCPQASTEPTWEVKMIYIDPPYNTTAMISLWRRLQPILTNILLTADNLTKKVTSWFKYWEQWISYRLVNYDVPTVEAGKRFADGWWGYFYLDRW